MPLTTAFSILTPHSHSVLHRTVQAWLASPNGFLSLAATLTRALNLDPLDLRAECR